MTASFIVTELFQNLANRDSHIPQLHQDALITRGLVVLDEGLNGMEHLFMGTMPQGSEGRAQIAT
jgi:hypothetical protein